MGSIEAFHNKLWWASILKKNNPFVTALLPRSKLRELLAGGFTMFKTCIIRSIGLDTMFHFG
jgi:hypothetical protein